MNAAFMPVRTERDGEGWMSAVYPNSGWRWRDHCRAGVLARSFWLAYADTFRM